MGVAGKPTTTTPIFRFSISRPNALPERTRKIVRITSVAAKQHEGYVNPYRLLLKQACKTTIWSFQCFLLEAEYLFTKAFF